MRKPLVNSPPPLTGRGRSVASGRTCTMSKAAETLLPKKIFAPIPYPSLPLKSTLNGWLGEGELNVPLLFGSTQAAHPVRSKVRSSANSGTAMMQMRTRAMRIHFIDVKPPVCAESKKYDLSRTSMKRKRFAEREGRSQDQILHVAQAQTRVSVPHL